jgi:two-component system response regulator FixJ
MIDRGRIALIDDDGPILDSLQLYLRRKGFNVSTYDSAFAFLAALDGGSQFQCLVTDVRMPKMTGLELQRLVLERCEALPIIMITGHGDIAMAVAAVRAGAYDFIEKPIDESRLARSISDAIEQTRTLAADNELLGATSKRFGELSERQRQVVELAIDGLSNKEIGSRLGISPRTVEHYRESAMDRMHARGFAELIQIVVKLKAYKSFKTGQPTRR